MPGRDVTEVAWVPGPAAAEPAAPWPAGPDLAAPVAPPATTAPVEDGVDTSPDGRGNVPAGALGMLGALLVLAGVALPWITVGSIDVSGWSASDDAKALVGLAALAIVTAALLIGGARGLALRVVVLVLGVAVVAVAAYDVASVDEITRVPVERGPGLFVVLGGGVLVTLSGVVVRHRRDR